MESKKNCIIFSLYSDNKSQKGTLRYNSFKFLCLSLYMIGFYYVFLNISLENESLEIVKNCNVYKRNLGEAQTKNNGPKWRKYLKLKNEEVNKTKSNGNIKSNEEKVEENKHSTNNDNENNNVENKSNSSMNNINYNDMSKTLTEKELFDVLNSLKECPPKEDLRNIWNHAVGIAKEGLDDIIKELKAPIQKYLDNDIFQWDGFNKRWFYDNIWKEYRNKFCQSVIKEEMQYTQSFLHLINHKHTLDEILKFIYSFLEYFQILKKDLYEKYKEELLKKLE
ncbi:Plasmodium exported protein (PHIST), unknown, putative [Plasmodium sp. DRC-Itaito]|nr:Plasmodium exported protein (PHIST), unknown, putative [Plasmodium sp. DRC-Itaito]